MNENNYIKIEKQETNEILNFSNYLEKTFQKDLSTSSDGSHGMNTSSTENLNSWRIPKLVKTEDSQSQSHPPQEKEKMKKKFGFEVLPGRGEPGGKGDPLRKGLSGAGVKWYLRHLAEGHSPTKARAMVDARKINSDESFTRKSDVEQKKRSKQNQEVENLYKRRKVSSNTDEPSSSKSKTNSKTIEGSIKSIEDNLLSCSKLSSSIKVIIIAKDSEEILTEKDMLKLEESILDDVARGWNIKIIFGGIHIRRGVLLVECADENSAEWLIEMTPRLSTWKGTPLVARKIERQPKPHNATIYFSRCGEDNIERAFKLLEAQNFGICTKNWKVIGTRIPGPNGIILDIAIDEDSMETIGKLDYSLNYRYGIVKVHRA